MTRPADQTNDQWRLVVLFVVLGLLARSLRYVLQFPLWEDEAFLFVNIVNRSYAELMEPLPQFHQFAPILFLWVEKGLIDTLGASELSVRLFPFLCAVASLMLFADLARRLLQGWAMVFAISLLAVSYPALRYAAEMKQYGVDLFAAVLLLWMWQRWSAGQPRWLLILAVVTPVLVWLSFPVVFVAGGVSLVSFAALWSQRRHDSAGPAPSWIPWLIFNAGLVLSFCLFLLVSRPHFDLADGWMTGFWQNEGAFPPWTRPGELPLWLLQTHAGKFLAFPAGSSHYGSSLTLLLCVLGAVSLWRTERRSTLLLLLLGPMVLQMIAAGMHKYPYGGHFKFAMALAPAICLLAGSGVAWLVRLLGRGGGTQRRIAAFWLSLFALVIVAAMVRDVVRPYKTLSDERARGWAQWFWHDAPRRAVVVDLQRDLGLEFAPRTFQDLSWSAMYLANQTIYSPRHGRDEPPAWSRVSATRPLWLVEYRDPAKPYREEAYQQWLAHVSRTFEVGKRLVYPMARYQKNERDLIKVDEVHVLPLVPRVETFTIDDLRMPR